LEHLDDPAIFIKEAMRILKPKGWIAISVPHKETMAGEVDGKNHLWSFDKEDLFGLLKNYGRVKIKILGSQHFPMYKYKFPSLLAWCQKND
jgi:ubiquinone/menaquinone biosynthesis C-methylase UbiE